MENKNLGIKKEEILNITIDLFVEHGVRKVSADMVAKKSNIARSVIYYYFKNGKDEIIDHIINDFNTLVAKDLKTITINTPKEVDADSILTSLYLKFNDKDLDKGRKINKIIFADHAYNDKFGKYLSDVFFKRRKARYCQLFSELITNCKVKPFDVEAAARIFNGIFIAFVLEDSLYYPLKGDDLPHNFDSLKEDCTRIINLILNGCF